MILQVKGLSVSFGGVKALDDATLQVPKGKITSIIGPNGAGKTTLFNAICGITRIDSGKISFDGQDITGHPTHRTADAGISRTFQAARLFRNLSVRDNLLLAKQTDDKELLNALKSVHFHLGLDVKASDLSYGQSRLLEIARAILHPHSLLMLDEPTAGVNPKVREELKRILRDQKKKGASIVLIEHDMPFVMDVSDHVIVLSQGRLLAQGSPMSIQKNKLVLEAYLGK